MSLYVLIVVKKFKLLYGNVKAVPSTGISIGIALIPLFVDIKIDCKVYKYQFHCMFMYPMYLLFK